MDRGESIATWLEKLADNHMAASEKDQRNYHYHRGIAILYRARASDVKAGLDLVNGEL